MGDFLWLMLNINIIIKDITFDLGNYIMGSKCLCCVMIISNGDFCWSNRGAIDANAPRSGA